MSRASEPPAPSLVAPALPVPAKCDNQCQSLYGTQCKIHTTWGPPEAHASASPAAHQALDHGRIKAHTGPSEGLLPQSPTQASRPDRILQSRDTPSQGSTTGLPGIPSVCMLSHDQRPATDNQARHDASQSRQTVAGLGLSMMHLESMRPFNRQLSPTPTSTMPDHVSAAQAPHPSYGEPDNASTRANSINFEVAKVGSPSRAILDQVLDFNRNLHLDIAGDTVPNTYNPHDFIQSATEVATPSVRQTPDLGAADQAVQEGKSLIDTLIRLTSNAPQSHGSPSRAASATSDPTVLLTNPPSTPQEQLQTLIRSASPQGLQKLVSYLAPLHNLLNSIPNVANSMRDFGNRLDMLENGSFNYVQPEDLNHTLEMYEGRLIDIEHRMEGHDKSIQALDDNNSTSSFTHRRIDNANTSFGSNNSLQSTTSSALILAAMDRKDTDMEIDHIKDRLDMLEAAALPTSVNPWEVEVVLLPWARDLRGIWFSPEEPMHTPAGTTTQDSEEWTQAQASKRGQSLQLLQDPTRATDSRSHSAVSSKSSMLSDTESGWSSQAISDWASGSSDDWLCPKACGSTNLVYKRLQSRGFIRDVTFKSASARDIQKALSHAFVGVLQHLQYDDSDGNPLVTEYPGLQASYIPLRKVMKESRLRFLTPAEMSSSALWSAQFLAAGVMMRVSGGKKRLYMTSREGYIQQNDFAVKEQSWPELRQLPRFQQPDQDSQMEGNDDHCQPEVPEADAKEACWQFVEAYDAPPASIHSSFGSNQSVQLSMRPADRQWRRSITPSSILKNKHFHPISPLSENHPQRPRHDRQRTVSASVVETFPPGPSKRRFDTSPAKQSSAPQTASRAPSISVTRLKRRRVTKSSSQQSEEPVSVEGQVMLWNPTPISRRSREPPSPFYSSLPALARSNSDVTSRPSQRSVPVAGKSTPFAYATPHSGPFVGGPVFGGYDNGGDTEPDDEVDANDEDDGEQSWRGVTDGDDDSASSSASEAVAGAEASFSGDDSGFESESADNEERSDDDTGFGAQQHQMHEDEDEEEDGDEDEEDVFDSLLDVLEH